MSDFACNMHAMAPHERQQHIANSQQVFQLVQAIEELGNGYAFRLPYTRETLQNLAEFIVFERLCCPFFGFALEIKPDVETVCLSLTGRDGVKPFIQAEFSNVLGERAFETVK
jgi:hypothetical protein